MRLCRRCNEERIEEKRQEHFKYSNVPSSTPLIQIISIQLEVDWFIYSHFNEKIKQFRCSIFLSFALAPSTHFNRWLNLLLQTIFQCFSCNCLRFVEMVVRKGNNKKKENTPLNIEIFVCFYKPDYLLHSKRNFHFYSVSSFVLQLVYCTPSTSTYYSLPRFNRTNSSYISTLLSVVYFHRAPLFHSHASIVSNRLLERFMQFLRFKRFFFFVLCCLRFSRAIKFLSTASK